MSKPHASRALLSALALSLVPVFGATISSDDEVGMRLGFDAIAVGLNQYEVPAGGTVLLNVQTAPTDLLWVYAVAEDPWGEPDYSNILTLFLDQPRGGRLTAFLAIPAELVGMTFHLQAIAQPLPKGDLKCGPEFEVAITGALILQPPHGN